MRAFAYAVMALLLAALTTYFFATAWLAKVTGLAPRTISLTAGFAVVLLGIAAAMIGRLSAQRSQGK